MVNCRYQSAFIMATVSTYSVQTNISMENDFGTRQSNVTFCSVHFFPCCIAFSNIRSLLEATLYHVVRIAFGLVQNELLRFAACADTTHEAEAEANTGLALAKIHVSSIVFRWSRFISNMHIRSWQLLSLAVIFHCSLSISISCIRSTIETFINSKFLLNSHFTFLHMYVFC